MAKSKRGGQSASKYPPGQFPASPGTPITFPSGTPNIPQPPQAPLQATQAPTSISATYNKFVNGTDDEKADIIEQTISQGVPFHLADNPFQRFIYNMGLNDKPDVVSDKQLDKMSGNSIYRTINENVDHAHDLYYSAPQIAKQIMGGSSTRVSDTGGSAHGHGIYFADSKSHSIRNYGKYPNNVKMSAVIRCKLNSNAKVISESSALSGLQHEIRSGSKLGNTLGNISKTSAVSIYAMSKGYNVIHDSWSGYSIVLNRQALTFSDRIDPI